MTKNIEVGKYTVKPQCADECALFETCQTAEGRTLIAGQILKAVENNDIRFLPIEVLTGRRLGARPTEGKTCLHLGRLIGATLPTTPIASTEAAEAALEWAVERGFGHSASITQPRD